MYSMVDGLIHPRDTWLTIGDGKGMEAHYLKDKGIENVLATDISSSNLKIAKEKYGYINSFGEENAEKLSFKDKSFEYVLCKESFHHFSKPIVALYEMIRVAKKGVVLIEPNDFKAFKNRMFVNHFEKAGNYVYSISVREFEKITLSKLIWLCL